MNEPNAVDWHSDLPAVVRARSRSPGHPYSSALMRWTEVAARLHLPPFARVVGATLLAQELDEDLRGPGTSGPRVACTRGELLALVRVSLDAELALAGLATLEACRVVCSSEAAAGIWAAVPIALAAPVRNECLGVQPTLRFSVPTEPVELLRRVRRELEAAIIAGRTHSADALHVIVRGRHGSGRDTVVRSLLAMMGRRACVRTPLDLRAHADSLEPALSGNVALWDGRGVDLHPDDLARASTFLDASLTFSVSVVDSDQDAPRTHGRSVLVVRTDPVDAAESREAWRAALVSTIPSDLLAAVADDMGTQTRVGTGLARRAARATVVESRLDRHAWCAALRSRLEDAAQPSTLRGVIVEYPALAIDRLVVSETTLRSLEKIRLLARHVVSFPCGRVGVKALFSGPPGTGKTLASRALASELGRSLYRVDLASVTSKWVGETEKNLRRIFDAAETTGALLLFDEGDALFGKRGEVERGADRYANLEVSFLLQAIEEFCGIAIVTTNLRENIDRAFQRRFDICADFRMPDALERARLWRQELGDDTAVSELALRRISNEAELTGGQIAVACRIARALAFTDGRPVTDANLTEGLCTELRKVGSNVAANRWETRATV